MVISGSTEDKSDQYFVCNKFIKELNKNDYELDEKNKNVMLSEKGIDKIEKLSKTYGILKIIIFMILKILIWYIILTKL